MNGLFWVFLSVISLGLLLHLLARLFEVSFAARLLGPVPWLPTTWCSPLAEGEPLDLLTRDGIRLRATYFATPSGRRQGVLAVGHEFNGDRWSTTPYWRALWQCGFDVLVFDFRNHGESARLERYEPMPWVTQYELTDFRAVVDYLCARPDADPRGIGLIGAGRGGTAALCLAAQDPRVRAVAVDGLIPTEQMQIYSARQFLRRFVVLDKLAALLPDSLLALLGSWAKQVIGWRCHCRLVRIDQAARRLRQPLLLIHGRHDPYLPLDVVCTLRKLITSPVRLWTAEHVEHTRVVNTDATEYERRVARFFTRHLSSPEQADQVLSAAGSSIARRSGRTVGSIPAGVMAIPILLFSLVIPSLRHVFPRMPW